MRKIKLSLLVITLALAATAQQPIVDISTLSGDVKIDGLINEDCWMDITPIAIEKDFGAETPSLTASWKAAWTEDGLFVAVEVDDDVWAPTWVTGKADWESDKIDVYFDFSDPQRDEQGSKDGNGDYQYGQYFQELTTGVGIYSSSFYHASHDSSKCYFSYNYDGLGKYSAEYFIPADQLFVEGTIAGVVVELVENTVIGFDVTITDNDDDGSGRKRKVWANDGTIDESWNNMDDVGLLTLKGDGNVVNINHNVGSCDDTARTVKTICQGSSYDFNGQNISQAGVYYHSDGCLTTELTLNVATEGDTTIINRVICSPESYNFFERYLSHSGTYYHGECVDVTQLNLTVNSPSYTNVYPVIFKGQTYLGYSESGYYQKRLNTATGCDSLVNITLGVIESVPSDVVVTMNTVFITVVDASNLVTVQETSGDLYVKMYPNPADVFLKLSADQEIIQVRVLNIGGTEVLSETVNATAAEIDIANLLTGTYVVELEFSYGRVTKTLIVE